MASHFNYAVAQKNSESLQSNQVQFSVLDILPITILKSIIDQQEYYYQGDTITFLIELERESIVTSPVGGISVTDNLPSVVSITSADVTTGSGGPVTITGQTVSVANVLLDDTNPICQITIVGTINIL